MHPLVRGILGPAGPQLPQLSVYVLGCQTVVSVCCRGLRVCTLSLHVFFASAVFMSDWKHSILGVFLISCMGSWILLSIGIRAEGRAARAWSVLGSRERAGHQTGS